LSFLAHSENQNFEIKNYTEKALNFKYIDRSKWLKNPRIQEKSIREILSGILPIVFENLKI